MKNLLQEAAQEIRGLRQHNAILSAKVETMDFMKQMLQARAPEGGSACAPDVVRQLEEAIQSWPEKPESPLKDVEEFPVEAEQPVEITRPNVRKQNGGGRKAAPVVERVKRTYKPRVGKARPEPLSPSPLLASSGSQTRAPLTSEAPPTTFGGAMKLEILRIKQPFTADELRMVLATNHAALAKEVGDSALSGNLSYWTSKGRLAKTDNGYRMLDPEFFQVPQN